MNNVGLVFSVKRSTMETPKLQAVLICSPGIGHLTPILELAHHLVTRHHIAASVFIVTTGTSPAESLTIRPYADLNLFDIVDIPAADISDVVGPDATPFTRGVLIMRETVPAIRATIAAMTRPPDLLIADLFGAETMKVADELGMGKYIYVPTTAWFLALILHCHVLDKEVVGEYIDKTEPLGIPGCKPVRPEDLVDPMLDRGNQQYRDFLQMGMGFRWADGILLNTWEDLERRSLRSIRENEGVSVYPIGPLMRRVGSVQHSRNETMAWLNNQPKESVIYVSFGSGGTISSNQITELALGLELSQQRFIWVVRPPNDKDPAGSFFTAGSGTNDFVQVYMPDGFLARIQKIGLVVPLWAAQHEILSHPSVGGFMTHCGWNSVLEGFRNGLPLVAWPLYAEQRMNAAMLVEELGVAVRSASLPTKEVVGRREIERMVRSVMEGEKGKGMRAKVKELMSIGDKALAKGGSSYNSLCEVIKNCEMILKSKKV